VAAKRWGDLFSASVRCERRFIEMNESRGSASGWVQRLARKVTPAIEETGHPAGTLRDPFREELSMLKTISAALLAVSVIAAPAIAASTAQAPATKSAAVTTVKKNPLNANAKMGHGHHHMRHHRHHGIHNTMNHRTHKKMAVKFHKSQKLSAKPVSHPAKRG
jgi:hypothetical protein